jgi:predicted amidophosphoribosyltransferase
MLSLPRPPAAWHELPPLQWLMRPAAPCVLPPQGLRGLTPLPWWAAISYAGDGRRAILQLRRDPTAARLSALLPGLVRRLRQWPQPTLLLPIPSWKRQANPLPGLLARQLRHQLGWPCDPQLLERSRPVLGQHRLNRELRWANQQGAFRCLHRPGHASLPWGCRTVMLLDDILTTGATACAAAAALEAKGWRVAGLSCLGRTPAQPRPKGRDLRSSGRLGGGPG